MKGVRRKRAPHTGFADLMNSTNPSTIPHGVITGVAHSTKPTAAKSPPPSNPDDWDVLLKSPPKRRMSPQRPIATSTASLKDTKESSELPQTTTSTTTTSSTTVPHFLSGWDGADGWGDDPSLDGSDGDLDEDAWGAWPVADTTADDAVSALAEDSLPPLTDSGVSSRLSTEPLGFEDKSSTELSQQQAREPLEAWDCADDRSDYPLSVEPSQIVPDMREEQNIFGDFPTKPAVWGEPPVPVVTHKLLESMEEVPSTLNDDRLREDTGPSARNRDFESSDWNVSDDQVEHIPQAQPEVSMAVLSSNKVKSDLLQPRPSIEVGEEGVTSGASAVDESILMHAPETDSAAADAWNGWNGLPSKDDETAASVDLAGDTFDVLPSVTDASALVQQQGGVKVEESSNFLQPLGSTVDESTFAVDSRPTAEYSVVDSSFVVDASAAADVADTWGEWTVDVEEQKGNVVSEVGSEAQAVQESIHAVPEALTSDADTAFTSEAMASPLRPLAVEKVMNDSSCKPAISDENELAIDSQSVQPVAGHSGERDGGRHSVDPTGSETTQVTPQALSSELSAHTTLATISTEGQLFQSDITQPPKNSAFRSEGPVESPVESFRSNESFQAQYVQTDEVAWVDWDNTENQPGVLEVPAVLPLAEGMPASKPASQTKTESPDYFTSLSSPAKLGRTAHVEDTLPRSTATSTSSADRSATEGEQQQGRKHESDGSDFHGPWSEARHILDEEKRDRGKTVFLGDDDGLTDRMLSTEATATAEGEGWQERTNCIGVTTGQADDGDGFHGETHPLGTGTDASFGDGYGIVAENRYAPNAMLWDWEEERQRFAMNLEAENEERNGVGPDMGQDDAIFQNVQEEPFTTEQDERPVAVLETTDMQTITHVLTEDAVHVRAETSSEIAKVEHLQLRTCDEDGWSTEVRSTDVNVSSTVAGADVPSIVAPPLDDDNGQDSEQMHASPEPSSNMYSTCEQVHRSEADHAPSDDIASIENLVQDSQVQKGGLFGLSLPAGSVHGNGDMRAPTNSDIRVPGHLDATNDTLNTGLKHVHIENKSIPVAHSPANVGKEAGTHVVLGEDHSNIFASLNNEPVDREGPSSANKNDWGGVNQNQNNNETRGREGDLFEQNFPGSYGCEVGGIEDVSSSFAVDEEWLGEAGRTEFDVPQLVDPNHATVTTESKMSDENGSGQTDHLQSLPYPLNSKADVLVMNANGLQHTSSQAPAEILSSISEKGSPVEAQPIEPFAPTPSERGSEPLAQNQHDQSKYEECASGYWTDKLQSSSPDGNAQSEEHYMEAHEIWKYAPKHIDAMSPRLDLVSNSGEMARRFARKDEDDQNGIGLHDDETSVRQSALDSFQPTPLSSHLNQQEVDSFFEQDIGPKVVTLDDQVPFDSHCDVDSYDVSADTESGVLVQRDTSSTSADHPVVSHTNEEQRYGQESKTYGNASFFYDLPGSAPHELEFGNEAPVSQSLEHAAYAPTRPSFESFREQGGYSLDGENKSETLSSENCGVDTPKYSALSTRVREGDLAFGKNIASEKRELDVSEGGDMYKHTRVHDKGGTPSVKTGNQLEAVHIPGPAISVVGGSAVDLEEESMATAGKAANEEENSLELTLTSAAEPHAFSEIAPSENMTICSQNERGEQTGGFMHSFPNTDNDQKSQLGQNEKFHVKGNPHVTIGSVYAEPTFQSYAPPTQAANRTHQPTATQHAQSVPEFNLGSQDEGNDAHNSHLAPFPCEPRASFGGETSTDGLQESRQDTVVPFPPHVTPRDPLVPVEPNTVGTFLDAGYSTPSRIQSYEPNSYARGTNDDKLLTVNAPDQGLNPNPPELAIDSSFYSYPFSIMDALPTGGMEYRPPRPVISWGFGGKLVTFFPRCVNNGQYQTDNQHSEPSQGTYPVCLHDISAIGGDTGDEDLVSVMEAIPPLSFPIRPSDLGPLSDMCERIASKLRGGKTSYSESSSALWRLLALLCRNCGSDWRREASSAISGPSLVPTFGRLNSSTLMSNNNMPESPLNSQSFLSGKSDVQQVRAASDVEKLLTEGNGSRAVQVAREAGLWSLAIVIASTIDRILYMETVSEFAKANLKDGSALQILCFSLAENDAEITRRATSDFGLSEWRKTVGVLLNARNSSMPSTDGAEMRFLRLVEQVGDALISRRKDVAAGQVCYLVSGRISTLDNSRLPILGADMKVPAGRPRSCGSSAAILQSLVFEATTNVQRGESFPHILPFRLLLSEAICAAGRPEIALKHCESLSNSVRVMFESDRRHLAVHLFTPPFLARLEALEQMLQSHLGLKSAEKRSKLTALGLSLSAVFKSASNEREPGKTKRLDTSTALPYIPSSGPSQAQPPQQMQFSQHIDHSQPIPFPQQNFQPFPTTFAPMVGSTAMQMPMPVTGDAYGVSGRVPGAATTHSTPTVPFLQQNSTRMLETTSVQSKEQKTTRNERLNSLVSKTIGMLAPADGDLSPPPRTRSSSNFPMNAETTPSLGLGPRTGNRAPSNNLSTNHMRSASTGDVPMMVASGSGQMAGQTNSYITAVPDVPSVPNSVDVSHRRSISAMTGSTETSERKPPRPPRRSSAASTSAMESSDRRATAPKGWKARIRERIVSALRGPPQAHLGDDSKFIYDKERGRWVIEGEDPDEEDDVPPPPPDDDALFEGGSQPVSSSVSYDNLRGEISGSLAFPQLHGMQDSRSTGELDYQDSMGAATRAVTRNPSHQPSLMTPLRQTLHGSATDELNELNIGSNAFETSSKNTSALNMGKGSHSSSPALPSMLPNRYRAHTGRRSARRAYVDTFNRTPVAGPSVSAASIGRPVAPGTGGLMPRPGGFNVFTPNPASLSETDFSESGTRQGSDGNEMSFSQRSTQHALTSAEDYVSKPLQSANWTPPQPDNIPLGNSRMKA